MPETVPPTPLTATEVSDRDGLENWTFVLGFLQAEFRCQSLVLAAELAASIAGLAVEIDPKSSVNPDIDLRNPGAALVRLQTESVAHVTELDVKLAQAISTLAVESGVVVATDRSVQQMEIAIDTIDHERIWPFWAAVFDYEYQARFEALVDRRRQSPTIWFQKMDKPRPVRNRIHFDITVPPAQAHARIEAALAAGGTLVSDDRARAFWILADADGNEVCVCTWQDRG